ncbi:Uncharacterised protein [Mycobacteroides abscessus subsp. abscessus]|nr:Uncharacterised protein [Mycobacteroides abscessus subsp. abscessus]SKU47981.1 Uncharacterised protein [Mycobacteroides abscessus subsp. abscessus]
MSGSLHPGLMPLRSRSRPVCDKPRAFVAHITFGVLLPS